MRRKLHAGREHAFGAEAEVVALQLDEAAHQQTGAGQQHERQRHFGDDERAEHAVQPAAAAVTSAVAQRIARVARRDECRNETKDDAGRQRDDHRERDHRQIERHLVEPRNRNAIADQREQAAMTQRRDAQPRDAAGGREHQAFGEHLAHQPAASCAKRRSHAELALARGAPRQQQIRDVDAGHEQHEQRRRPPARTAPAGAPRPSVPAAEGASPSGGHCAAAPLSRARRRCSASRCTPARTRHPRAGARWRTNCRGRAPREAAPASARRESGSRLSDRRS